MSIENGVVVGAPYVNDCTNLVVVEKPVKDSVKCKCNWCGTVDAYKVSQLTRGEVQGCKTCRLNLKVGDVVGDFAIDGFKFHSSLGFVSGVHCNKCNAKFLKTPAALKQSSKCAKCVTTKVVAPTVTQKVETKETAKTKSAKPTKIVGNIQKFVDDFVENNYRKIGNFIVVGTKTRSSKQGASITTLLKCRCIKCGATSLMRDELEVAQSTCKRCERMSDEHNNIIENTNWVGYTRHSMQVISTLKDSDGIISAKIRCLLCGREFNMPIVSFFNESEITCDNCGDTKLSMKCPECGKNEIYTTPKLLYRLEDENSKTFTECKSCKKLIRVKQLMLRHELEVKLETLEKKFKDYDIMDRHEGFGDFASIIKFSQNYTGTDGEVYYTCMCETHNKLMVLREDEITTYKHQYCAETRMLPYNPKKKPKE